MDSDRHAQLLELQSFIAAVDNNVTMILQSLQWDRKHLLESPSMVVCKHDAHHRIPLARRDAHEERCLLRREGGGRDLLPDLALGAAHGTLLTLRPEDIQRIINEQAQLDPLFRRGGCLGGVRGAPRSLAELQAAHSPDERRALYDAVAAAAAAAAQPHHHDNAPWYSVGGSAESARGAGGAMSRAELLAELRDARRRRPKYRVTNNHKNYSHALRDVIAAQMEMYGATHSVAQRSDTMNIKVESDKDDDRNIREPSETKYVRHEHKKGHSGSSNQRASDHSLREGSTSSKHKREHDHMKRNENSSSRGNRGYDEKREPGRGSARDSIEHTDRGRRHGGTDVSLGEAHAHKHCRHHSSTSLARDKDMARASQCRDRYQSRESNERSSGPRSSSRRSSDGDSHRRHPDAAGCDGAGAGRRQGARDPYHQYPHDEHFHQSKRKRDK